MLEEISSSGAPVFYFTNTFFITVLKMERGKPCSMWILLDVFSFSLTEICVRRKQTEIIFRRNCKTEMSRIKGRGQKSSSSFFLEF